MNFLKGGHKKLKKLRRPPTEKPTNAAADSVAAAAISDPPTLNKLDSINSDDDIYVYTFDTKKLQWLWIKCEVQEVKL